MGRGYDASGDSRGASTGQGPPETASHPPEAWVGAQSWFSSWPQKGPVLTTPWSQASSTVRVNSGG